jgi:microcystin degradation protein MlrC
VVESHSGTSLHVVLTERRVPPYDLDHLTATGLVPEQLTMIVVKAAAGWRVAFEEIMSSAIYLDTPGLHAADLRRFDFRHRPVPLYPLETDAQWPVPSVHGARSVEALV